MTRSPDRNSRRTYITIVMLENNWQNNIIEKNNSFLPQTNEVGSERQEWNRTYTQEPKRSQFIDYPKHLNGITVDLAYELKTRFEQNPNIINPTKYSSVPELFNAVAQHAHRRQRLSSSTIDHRLRCARRMQQHPVFPINFSNLNYEQFSAYMQYREDIENAEHFALKNDLQAVQMFLIAYGKRTIDDKNPRRAMMEDGSWFYRLPPVCEHKDRKIPPPDVVHQLITHEYSDDPYTSNLYQTIFAHSFWIGWRVPCEICVLSTDDVDFDDRSIRITEPKKHYSTRKIYPDEVILSAKTRKSFKNYLDKWRPKVECSKSGNAFYLTPNGLPFTPRHLGHELSERGKQVFPEFKPYVSRHWNATAMLIRTKLETGAWDKHEVQTWLGHEKEMTTETYVDQAKGLFKQYPFDWIKRTLKFDVIIEVESALKSKQGRKTSVSNGKSGKSRYGLVGI